MDPVQGAKAGLAKTGDMFRKVVTSSVTQTVVTGVTTGVITLVVASQINRYVTSRLQKENA